MSDNALYLYKDLPKHLIRFHSYGPESRVDARVVANVDGRTDVRTDVQTDERAENRIPIPHHA